nr:uncharacterized protein LOC105332604 [Crassostrea gigas]
MTQQVSAANRFSCAVSKSTVKIVKECPKNEEEWKKAAVRKNCTAYASQCDQPNKFVYHCLINPYVNETLEVCAYKQNILSGYCTEYNIRGNLIQSNARANCSSLQPNPCPPLYASNEAYKYQGCYALTKKSTSTTDRPDTTPIAILTTTPSPDLPNKKDKESTGSGISYNMYYMILLLIFVRLWHIYS